MTQSDLTVLYITGWCRNGSTLVGNILNEAEGIFHAGELHYLWRNSSARGTNTSCGCGQPLASCGVWSQVLAQAARPGAEEAPERVLARQRSVRTRRVRRVLRFDGKSDAELASYADLLARTYRAIQSVTGASVIVDGGKYPAEAALLPHVAGIQPVYLHLVRDPRASACSWYFSKEYIPSMSAVRSTGYWVAFNLASDALRRRHPQRSLLLRYEDVIADPAAGIDAILTALGLPRSRNPMQGRTVHLGPNHTVTGNPDRLVHGDVVVRAEDVDWRKKLPRRAALAATLLSLPFASRYGY